MDHSALESLEELERLYREHAIESPPVIDQYSTWVGTSLGIADVLLLVGDGEIEEIIETPSVAPIPGTRPWVLGVASHMGGLLPIINGDVFFRGQSYQGRPREWCMVIKRQGYHFGMTLSSVERDMKFPVEERDMTTAIDSDFSGFTLGGFHHRNKFLAVLDLDRLLANSELADASIAQTDSNEEDSHE
jgi:twitching motility protein PilI